MKNQVVSIVFVHHVPCCGHVVKMEDGEFYCPLHGVVNPKDCRSLARDGEVHE